MYIFCENFLHEYTSGCYIIRNLFINVSREAVVAAEKKLYKGEKFFNVKLFFIHFALFA